MWRLLKTLFVAVSVIWLAANFAHADYHLTSDAFGKRYVVTISQPALDESPEWDAEADNPPLGARKALKLATDMKNSLVEDSEKFKWRLESLSLKPVPSGKWYWLANYEAWPRGQFEGRTERLRLVVLMDGTAIQPEVMNIRKRK
jgi:hypothetical protein